MRRSKEIAAFPRMCESLSAEQSGMTLRDWFAGQALCGLLTKELCMNSNDPCHSAYAYADRMLQLKKEIENEASK